MGMRDDLVFVSTKEFKLRATHRRRVSHTQVSLCVVSFKEKKKHNKNLPIFMIKILLNLLAEVIIFLALPNAQPFLNRWCPVLNLRNNQT